MGIKVRACRGRLYLDVYQQGRRWSEYLGMAADGPGAKGRWELAEQIKIQREYQLIAQAHNLPDPTARHIPLMEYARELAADMPPKNPVPKSLRYLDGYAGGIHLQAINERWLEGYQKYLQKQPALAAATQAKYYAAIVQILHTAVRDRLIPRNPADAVKGMKTPEPHKVFLTADELGRLAAAPIGGKLGAEVKRAFLFGAFTGLRVSDLRGLKWADIDREKKAIARRQEKTGRIVNIPLHPSAWELLDTGQLHNRIEAVFPLLTTKANTNGYINKWAVAAGIDKPIGWHTARHTFAVLTLEGGADFYTVSKLMGHSKPGTTAVYAKATDGMLKKAIDGLPTLGQARES